MKSSYKALQKRGYVEKVFIDKHDHKTAKELVKLLNSNNAQKRTVAAKLLQRYNTDLVIKALCEALKHEKKLYTKITICETLASIGEKAMPYLVELLGVIGCNQYKKLPKKIFQKKNYPLPRDIAARTIIRIGEVALSYLENVLANGDRIKVLEAIDAVGYICFYTKNRSSLLALKQCLKKYDNDILVIWKIIRAFESFPDDFVKKYLGQTIKDASLPGIIRKEAKRSLQQLRF